jgi:hypothetical protein
MISRKTRLNRIMNYEEHECYVTNSSKTSLTTRSFWRKTVTVIIIYTSMKNASSTKKFMKKKSSNEITAYDTFTVRQQLFDTAEKYSLWDKTENIVIDVLESEWMSVTLKSEVKIEAVKVYSMKWKKRELINETFNKLHDQEKMHWTTESITHEASIFVIWRMINEERKERMIINIRDLNKIVKFDSYSIIDISGFERTPTVAASAVVAVVAVVAHVSATCVIQPASAHCSRAVVTMYNTS